MMNKKESGLKLQEKVPAVICPVDEHMGLDIARILTNLGIPVFGIDHNHKNPGRFSRCLKYKYCPYSENKEKEYVDFLIEFAERLKRRTILFPLSDVHVYLISRFREKLNHHFIFNIPDHDLVEELVNKHRFYHLTCKHSIPAPKTFFVSDQISLNSIKADIIFPAIIKPEESAFWYSEKAAQLLRKGLFAGRPKVIYCRDLKELERSYEYIARVDKRVVIQEVIPGDDSNLIYVAFYCNNQSEIIGYFSGKKLRVIPKGFGSASFVKSYDDPELRTLVLNFLKAIRYKGFGGIEFKKDSRDGIYKIIEFNPRFGMWDALSARCGVNLPLIAYLDALAIPLKKQLKFKENIIWVDWQRDFRAFLEYRKAGQLTLWKWLRSFKGQKMVPIYSFYDWKPGLYFTLGLFVKLWDRIERIIASKVKRSIRT